ncbi:hypothetical protein U3653_22900 [Nocardia sp. CDC186]|uniref:Uncharacterized protein n=1 Tax=Nocardia implantans TaxID=3108168 RepID=A0ABU6AZN3_9NOCA|nr:MULTISPECIES: hypothetical protein [unclassified Nocardia]MBF6194025.1 hypothetical protein [Nocardia beijingensis]MEA3529632.1 hypothetical protein [Nocardia sp. CDC192]MEB3512890.1 hypothetical protein [Nocardia sp. CDC186]
MSGARAASGRRSGCGTPASAPKAINALNHSIALTMTEREFAEDDPVRTVVVTDAGR